LSQNTSIKPSQVILVKVILVLLQQQSLKKYTVKKNTFNTHHKPQIVKPLTTMCYTAIFWTATHDVQAVVHNKCLFKSYHLFLFGKNKTMVTPYPHSWGFNILQAAETPKQQQMPPVLLLLNRVGSTQSSLLNTADQLKFSTYFSIKSEPTARFCYARCQTGRQMKQ